MNKTQETHKRSVFKAISWRIVATLTTMSIVYMFTKKLILTLEVGIVEVMAKMCFYYFHERIWEKVGWGRQRHPLSDLPVKDKLKPQDLAIISGKLKELGYLD